ncbi:MAG: flippase-like domain-containing protein [Anaerolineae bacterium]|nr:flippase-like domain-containing protein [Anaerolineae bacterium]
MLKSKRFWIGLVITIVCLYLAFQGIQLDKLAGSFSQFNWWWLPVLIAVFMISYFGRVFRWQALFDPYKPRWGQVFAALNVGYFLSNITPARLGDLARAYLLGTIEKIPVAHAISTVVVERALDGLTVVLLLLALLPFIPNVPQEWVTSGLALGAIGIGALVGLAILARQRERGVAFLQRLVSPIKFLDREGLWRFVATMLGGFSVINSPRPLLLAIFWSLEVWLVSGLLAWLTMFSLGIHLPFAAGVLIQVAAALAVTVAPSPGQLGVFHLIAVSVLKLYGVDPNQALAYAFVLHGLTYILLMTLGIGSAWHEGIDLAKIQNISAQNRAVDEAASA